jgi:NADPH-dependent 2,4-dienoyl-CoA reductase/sulfur reductase-like enzyme
MPDHYDVIIVGSGPAGLAAVEVLSRHGLHILMVDESTHAGGQLVHRPSHTAKPGRRFDPGGLKHRVMRLAAQARKRRVRFLKGCQVLGIFPQQTLLVEAHDGKVSEYRSDTLILATGARERQLPFKGWTLPGVMGCGAAQILMKSSGILPGEKTLIAGSSPLMLVLAAEILAVGGTVPALLNQGTMAEKLKAFTAGPAIWPRLFEGAVCLARLAAARIPLKQGMGIVEARGQGNLETVVAGRIDGQGRLIEGTEQIYPADTLAVGHGFAPNTELPQQAGCAVSYDLDRGGWYVKVSASMATTVDNIYAVGEVTGIAGADKSLIEGGLAAWNILNRQGRIGRRTIETHTVPLMRRLRWQIRYGRFLNRLCSPPPGSYGAVPDETVVCRCEEITMGEIRRQIRHGFTTIDGIKKATRCGMGWCQGRICGPILMDILGRSGQQPPATVGRPPARAPVKPVALGALAAMVPGDYSPQEPGRAGESGKGT